MLWRLSLDYFPIDLHNMWLFSFSMNADLSPHLNDFGYWSPGALYRCCVTSSINKQCPGNNGIGLCGITDLSWKQPTHKMTHILYIKGLKLPALVLYICMGLGSSLKNEVVNLGACKFSFINKLHIFQCMDTIFCVEFQREPLKFHTKYLTHTLK